MGLQQVRDALLSIRTTHTQSEYDLHAAIAQALEHAGILYTREASLLPGSRIDFLAEGGVGIEVKRGKPATSTLLRQASRYCASPDVTSILIVVERSVLLPRTIQGKPCCVVSLNAMWGVALP